MTAKIYQFPIGGRAALGGRRYAETRPPVEPEPRVDQELCDSWRRDELIKEPSPTWERE